MNFRSTARLLSMPLLLMAGSLVAQEVSEGLAVQQFAPAPGGDYNFNHVHGSQTLGHLRPSFGLFVNYSKSPLELTDPYDNSVDLLTRQLQADVLAAIGLGPRLQLGLGIPVVLSQATGSSDTIAVPSIAGAGLGDIRIIPKFKLFGREHGPGLALEGVITVPTGSPTDYTGEQSVTMEPKLVLGFHRPRVRIGLNAGYLLRKDQAIYDLVQGNEITLGAGLLFGVVQDRLDLVGEFFGRFSADGDSERSPETSPREMNLSLRFHPSDAHAITLGGGPGLSAGYGTPTWRAFLGYTFTSRRPTIRDRDKDGILDITDQCPDNPEDVDNFQDADGCPDPDNDADGIPDTADKCPNKAEDKDGFQDNDGCPDPDNDADGVLDESDKCPTEMEDKDGFQDEDGCPDPDNDGDGILDTADKCPNEAEDKDGLGDEDGCPEVDFDQDGIADVTDKCPKMPETINGINDEDGCPDEGKSKVKMAETRIEIMEVVYFDTDKATIKKVSYDVLGQVASTLKAFPQITRLRVEGHTDDQADDDYNLKLSQARTESVVKFLVDRGVAQDRLEAVGYGETKPVDTNATDAGRAKNRRVEFTILEVNRKPVEKGPVLLKKGE